MTTSGSPASASLITAAKDSLRKDIRKRIRAMPIDDRRRLDALIRDRLASFPEFRSASVIAAYLPLPDEVDLRPLLQPLYRTRTVVLPRIVRGQMRFHRVTSPENDTIEGTMGIREPKDELPMFDDWAAPSVFVIVPGRAFDLGGGRLGRGGGYYDRLLAAIPPGSLAVAAAYDEQVVDTVPRRSWDVPVDGLVTPTRTLRFERSRSATPAR